MKKCIMLCILILVAFIRLYPEIVANMPELGKPTALRINNGHLFIIDEQTVRVYDLQSFTQVKNSAGREKVPGKFNGGQGLSLPYDGRNFVFCRQEPF
ncbi:MAG TPA: hypothetical protein VK469_03725 [Candidatus Kapabacteria bacterium]|nr:hypothetical protein [Candidatus Kapabacteria bacterium]